jgi:uncharacterized membrane protein YjjP (DUF1212 family)
MTARVLEIESQFLYIPRCMIISFDDSATHTTEVHLVRIGQEGVDLGKLKDTHEIYKEVVHDVIGVEEAIRRLDEIIERKAKFNQWYGHHFRGMSHPKLFFTGLWSACTALQARP